MGTITVVLLTYWFLFFVEIPRFVLLEYVVVIFQKLNRKKEKAHQKQALEQLYRESPLCTVLAPGKNEGKNIYKLITSLREQTYKNLEIIIVDDGSDDDTPLICTDLEKAGLIDRYLRCNIRGGKASAANYGVSLAKGKYIIHLDADSSLDRDAISKILLPFFQDRQVKAVGGAVKVRNNMETLCTSVQALEYLKRVQTGFLVTGKLGMNHIIMGAFGAFETETIRHLGCWDIGPGLDGDITQKIRKAGYRVAFADQAICMTNVPVDFQALVKQRRRWSRSLVRFRLRKHLDILLPNRNWNLPNFLSNLENVFYDMVCNYLWIIYICGIVLTCGAHLEEVVVLGYLLRLVYSALLFILTMLVSGRWKEELFLMRYLPLMPLYSGWLLRICKVVAHTEEFFFRSSYKDAWNPEKTSRYAELQGH